ncbi:MAG: hypothetical protein GY757_01985 [bacterium]|nr:hypothetical protein [bacterium]
MKIPKYWAKGAAGNDLKTVNPATGETTDAFSCWGWSDVSVHDAEAKGKQRADKIAQTIRRGKPPDEYLYGDKPMREKILDEWKNQMDNVYAAITLNAYGCRVLNTADIMFVDVDFPEPSGLESFLDKLKGWFGKSGALTRLEWETGALAKVKMVVHNDPGCGIRVYRTRAGFRHLLTHLRAEPQSEATLKQMEALGADPLYMRLCKMQKCFRARLTPKPWRCGMSQLPVRYPWQDTAAEKEAQRWLVDYATITHGFAICELVGHFGSTAMDAEMAHVVAFHDKETRVGSGLKLA